MIGDEHNARKQRSAKMQWICQGILSGALHRVKPQRQMAPPIWLGQPNNCDT